MGNTSSERAGVERQGSHKTPRRDSGGTKDGDRPKILMDSPEDADMFHAEEIKVCDLRRSPSFAEKAEQKGSCCHFEGCETGASLLLQKLQQPVGCFSF